MTINIAADGKHSYELEYTLPKKLSNWEIS